MVQSHSPTGGNVSSHEGTLAPPGEYDWTCASFGLLESTPQPKRQMDRFSRFAQLTAESADRPTLKWAPLSTRIAPSNGGSGPPCNTWCFGPMRANKFNNPNGTSIGSAVFAQMTTECPYTLQWFACFLLKTAPSHVGICTSPLGPPSPERKCKWQLHRFSRFAGLTTVTDWQSDTQTDRPRYSVRGGVIMGNYVGYSKATQSFHVSTNNFASIKSSSVRSKHLTKYLV